MRTCSLHPSRLLVSAAYHRLHESLGAGLSFYSSGTSGRVEGCDIWSNFVCGVDICGHVDVKKLVLTDNDIRDHARDIVARAEGILASGAGIYGGSCWGGGGPPAARLSQRRRADLAKANRFARNRAGDFIGMPPGGPGHYATLTFLITT